MNVARILFWTGVLACISFGAACAPGGKTQAFAEENQTKSKSDKESTKKEKDEPQPKSEEQSEKQDEEVTEVPADLDTEGMIALAKEGGVWIDKKRKWVVLDGKISLQRGALEMFACPKQTKEHESIVVVDAVPSVVHAGLVALGSKPGKPSTWVPEYEPVSGPEIEIWVLWKDAQGEAKKARAQEWVRNFKSKEEMDSPFIFGGSKIWKHPTTGETIYQADGGDFICVSNFPTAMIDVPIPSSQSEQDLLFEAFTERIPEPGTQVRLVLAPKPEKEKTEGKEGTN